MDIQEIFMIRPDLENIPEHPLPESFKLRSYHKGDEENWFQIYKAADHYNKIYSAMFKEYFGADEVKLGRRQFYICDKDERAIATATSWYNDDYHGESLGRVHWVAVHPDYQGNGLAKPLISNVLTRLKDLGHKRCYLRTLSVRTPAICLYLSFGFKPDIRTEADKEVWRKIGQRLNHPEIKSI
ncbi:MAG: GNAT family N-acetyltransferase [Lentisphaeraceae bacterium]|nr:GNAT family N-acetyltransferase [Lentisphaeraceae bacterium]